MSSINQKSALEPFIFPWTGFCFCTEVQSNEIKEKFPFRARGGQRRPNGAEEARKGKLVHKGLPKGKMVLNSGGGCAEEHEGLGLKKEKFPARRPEEAEWGC